MQAVFAFRQSQEANYNLALESFADYFAPDLNSMEKPDLQLLKIQKNRAKEIFKVLHETGKYDFEHNEDPDVEESVHKANAQYTENIKKDLKSVKQTMLEDSILIRNHYLTFLQLLAELYTWKGKYKNHLQDNKTLQAVAESENLEKEISKSNVAIDLDKEEKAAFIRDIIRKDIHASKAYKTFIDRKAASFEEDKEILLELIKKTLLKSETVQEYFDNLDVRWTENEEVVKGLVVKTIKDLNDDNDILVLSLSENWEEDREYFSTLFDSTEKYSAEITKMLKPKLKNWDIDRLASTDKIIIDMAIAEMIEFPSIPVKVSINEFIELAKKYSTPKSKIFINGLLDKLSKELMESNRIKKSGRGLIDNR
jgi:N utilization substance protein B